MKITLIIEIEAKDGQEPKATVRRLPEKPSLVAAPPATKLARIAEAAPPPVPPLPALPAPDAETVCKPGSGPQFDPGFLAALRDAPEPFTRRAIAVATGLKVEDVTMRLNRMRKRGWVEQPAPELWRKTGRFGVRV